MAQVMLMFGLMICATSCAKADLKNERKEVIKSIPILDTQEYSICSRIPVEKRNHTKCGRCEMCS